MAQADHDSVSGFAPDKRFHGAVAHLMQPERLGRLTLEPAEVLAIVVSDGMATRRRIEEVRGAAQLSIGPDGPVSVPRKSSETLALLLSRGLLCADRDDHANGRPLVYRPTPRLLQLLGVETLQEARGRMRGAKPATAPAKPTSQSQAPSIAEREFSMSTASEVFHRGDGLTTMHRL
jgi:hypothetical protein